MNHPFNSEAGGLLLIMIGATVTVLILAALVFFFPWEVATIAAAVFICSNIFDKDTKQ